jgi:hypothetical protein
MPRNKVKEECFSKLVQGDKIYYNSGNVYEMIGHCLINKNSYVKARRVRDGGCTYLRRDDAHFILKIVKCHK